MKLILLTLRTYNLIKIEGEGMAVPTNIRNLLSGNVVEWARIEFKETWDPGASLKTICAFANDIDNWGGGYLVIGVRSSSDGSPDSLIGVPINKIDMYLKDLLNKCKLIQPEYMPITEVVDYQGKSLSLSGCLVEVNVPILRLRLWQRMRRCVVISLEKWQVQ